MMAQRKRRSRSGVSLMWMPCKNAASAESDASTEALASDWFLKLLAGAALKVCSSCCWAPIAAAEVHREADRSRPDGVVSPGTRRALRPPTIWPEAARTLFGITAQYSALSFSACYCRNFCNELHHISGKCPGKGCPGEDRGFRLERNAPVSIASHRGLCHFSCCCWSNVRQAIQYSV